MEIIGDYERRECLSKVYANSEQRIKELVEQANTGSDSEHQSYISNSQAAWKHYRDEECALEGDDFRGGTLEKDQAAVCTISKNNERIKEIESDIGLASH